MAAGKIYYERKILLFRKITERKGRGGLFLCEHSYIFHIIKRWGEREREREEKKGEKESGSAATVASGVTSRKKSRKASLLNPKGNISISSGALVSLTDVLS